jgi:hypothetical protein
VTTLAARGGGALFVAGLLLGTLAPGPAPSAPLSTPDGEQVLEGDFHVHAYLGDGALPPWLLLQEARRNGLDVLAVTNHNQVFAARLVHGFAARGGGPMVLVAQEVTAGGFHMIAAGIRSTVDWRKGAQAAVAETHAQGGRALAAHPVAYYWPGLQEALGSLDGAEVWHPLVHMQPGGREELRAFHARLRAAGRQPAAIGSSDFHVMTALGLCRTYVFVRETSEAGVLEALGAGRTVVVDDQGQVHGDAERGRFLLESGAPARAAQRLRRTPLETSAVVAAWLGLLGLVVFRRRPDPREDGA